MGQDFERVSASAYRERLARLGANWGWLLATGIAFIFFGVAAFTWPVGSTLGLTFALGILFFSSGVVHLIQSFKMRRETDNGWRVFQGIVALATGLIMLRYPATGMMGIAIALAFYFFTSAVAKGVIAFGIRPLRGWGWPLISAIASFFLGVYIIAQFPVSALWIPGFLLGIDLVIHGSSLVGLSLAIRKAHRNIREALEGPSEIKKAA